MYTLIFILIVGAGFFVILMILRSGSSHAKQVPAETFDERNSLNIAGINYRGLTIGDCGTYLGYVIRDEGNAHDENAVAVYRSDDRHLGFLSKEIAADLCEKVSAAGGKIPCVLRVTREFEDGRSFFVGRVQILWDTV